ncbi:hypothetical protein M1N79_01195 [Dehalococcoidia bacterium]|nr:hypothetical protein [Dehalococcoidia bacterium]
MTYWIKDSKESGVILWLETRCGFKQPIVRWRDLNEAKRFAGMLSDVCTTLAEKHEMPCRENDDKVKGISDHLLRQALGDEQG